MLKDENLWWNKIPTLSDHEVDLLPFSFLKKYGTFYRNERNYRMEHKLDLSRA